MVKGEAHFGSPTSLGEVWGVLLRTKELASVQVSFAARQEAREARCVAWPPSQSPIGVVKRNHALNLASRIKNAYLARTKSSAGFRVADCLILLQEHGFNAG